MTPTSRKELPAVRQRLQPERQEAYLNWRYQSKYAGERCVVLAGGPSVRKINPIDLLPCRFISVNVVNYLQCFESIRPYCVAGVILDEGLLRRNFRRILRSGSYPLFVGNTPNDSDTLLEYLNDLGVHRIPSNYTEGFGDGFERFSNGGNSGFAAVQLAVIMGFTTIGLLGIDGAAGAEDTHFHGEYGSRKAAAHQLNEWCHNLDGCAALLELLGVTVVNLSPVSRLASFRKVDPIEWRAQMHATNCVAPASAIDRLRAKYGGSVEIPFPCRPMEASMTYGQTCFGGARNVSDPGRYRPLPAELEPFLTYGDEQSCLIEVRTGESPRPTLAPTAGKTRLSLSLLSEIMSSVKPPETAQAWLTDAAKDMDEYAVVMRLSEWLDSSAQSDVDLRIVALQCELTEAVIPKLLVGLRGLQSSVRGVIAACAGSSPEHRTALLSGLSRDWQLTRYSTEQSGWLTLALRPYKLS